MPASHFGPHQNAAVQCVKIPMDFNSLIIMSKSRGADDPYIKYYYSYIFWLSKYHGIESKHLTAFVYGKVIRRKHPFINIFINSKYTK